MKHFLRPFILFFLPVLLSACEEGVFGPRQTNCLEYRQTLHTGSTENITERVYDDDKIIELRNYQNGNLQGYYAFTYGSNGRISESQYFNVQNNTQGVINKITYNTSGKWVKVMGTNTTGTILLQEAEYNSQNQIQKYTASTNRAGTITVDATINYEWVGGNNTVLTFTSPTFRQTIRYEFDLERENKRRKDQENTAFLSSSVAHNQNVYKRIVNTFTNLSNGTTTETITSYNWQYNEEGYPIALTRTTTSGTGTSSVATTSFEYSCN